TYGWWGSITFEPAAIPCDDTTVASAVTFGPNKICPNKPYALSVKLANGLILTSMTYQWQYSYNGVSWANYTGVPDVNNGGQITDSITQDKWYRCKITCIS